MRLQFEKYQATGNDFVMIDNRSGFFPKDDHILVASICDRKFGVGADGLILIEESIETNFQMNYYNADGAPGSFCGNGSRAATRYAQSLGMITEKGSLVAFDGIHHAEIKPDVIKMSMSDVQNGSKMLGGTFIDTGSPHYVEFRKNLNSLDVFTEGKTLREHDLFKPGGSNINFVERIDDNLISVRTFERGVENETLSCGTGVTASAMTAVINEGEHCIQVRTLGGNLEVQFEKIGNEFSNVHLIGPAEKTFSGQIDI